MLNRKIWRHRRAKKRKRAQDELRVAAEKGALPNSKPKNVTINWKKVFGSCDAKKGMQDYYTEIYSLDNGTLGGEVEVKQHWIRTWQDLRIDLVPNRVTTTNLRKAIAKLKNGKGSPDGCTAEMYKHLPDHALQSLALFFTMVMSSLPDRGKCPMAGRTVVSPKGHGCFGLAFEHHRRCSHFGNAT